MKYFAVAALIGAISAVKLNDSEDCPASKQVFSYNSNTHPAAAGLVQISSCMSSGINGVTCAPPNSMLFAEGMDGTEDLGEKITMKGEKYSYGQRFAQTGKGFAEGMEGTEDLGEKITMKGEKYSYAQNGFAEGMTGSEDLGEKIEMKGEKFSYPQRF